MLDGGRCTERYGTLHEGVNQQPREPVDPFGYHGRVLRVDLGAMVAGEEHPPDDVYRRFAGGALQATRLLLLETPARLDPFDPRALLVFAAGPVGGHRAAALPRFSICAKSPLTGGIGEARAEGPWGVALKGSGFDAIVVVGRAEHPVYLLIDGGRPAIVGAEDLWRLETGRATEVLIGRHPGCHPAVIGPAGERLVRFASVVSDGSFQAARTGMGAVMGAKNLKGVVLAGGDARPPVADPDGLAGLTVWYAEAIPTNRLTRWQHEPPGFGAWLGSAVPGTYGVENYRTSVFDVGGYRADRFLGAMSWSDGGCPGCPNDCVKGFAPAAGRWRGGLHQEVVQALGANLGLGELSDVLELNLRCHELGLDPVSLGYTISFALECGARGLLSPGDLETRVAREVGFGNAALVRDLTERIARQEGIGDILAEGVRRASETLGRATAPLALHVKGLEMVGFEPRSSGMLALGYAVSPVGPRYDFVEHDIDFDPVLGIHNVLDLSRSIGMEELMPMASLDDSKVRAFRSLTDLWSALDALGICIFASAPTRLLSLDDLARLVRLVTGWDATPDEVLGWGRRRLHLLRIYNRREGITAAGDTLPARFFDEPIDDGPFTGISLDRDRFRTAVARYYASVGWDESGVPPPRTIAELDLEWTTTAAPRGPAT